MISDKRPLFDGQINFPIMLAPMVGLSHIGLRLLVRSYLPANARTIWPTEMLSSRRLPAQNVGETPETFRHESEDFLVPQILGNEEKYIRPSIERLKDWGARGIDINMGCPVRKALKHNYGVSLMGDPKYAAEVVDMARRSSDLPVSVKLRSGHQNDFQFLLNFVNGLVEGGASWVCLHPRTAEMKRKGKADWNQIKMLREAIDIPVIGNGDIQIYQDALRMFEETGCDGVMIGRALTSRPWILWQIGEKLGFEPPEGCEGKAPETKEEEASEYGRSLIYLTNVLEEYFEYKDGLRRFNFHLRVSHPWLNFGHALDKRLNRGKNFQEKREIISEFFAKPGLFQSHYTELAY
ncbi:MAG: tRNA-dihydrouridine synthase family protein [Oligoflexia bacterium]|nr:tRNA-dihydrouridine synthase family protein [Oligoflexia bacterium]